MPGAGFEHHWQAGRWPKLIEQYLAEFPELVADGVNLTGVGKILALIFLYEIHDISRFADVGKFLSYARLVRGSHESAAKKWSAFLAAIGASRPGSIAFGLDDPRVARESLQHAADSKYCLTCGAPHSAGAVYCWQCGTSLLEQVPGLTIAAPKPSSRRARSTSPTRATPGLCRFAPAIMLRLGT